MGEPVHRENHKKARAETGLGHGDPYAADVLLIAAREDERQPSGGNDAANRGAVEPLDMENVVRKLIALLNEQES
ncbi:MAG TPA: hypothetical protein VFH29_03760 [Anaerolineales bacterium]|nr:hypothetical protein [Anaerolineales bacterium]